MKRFLILTIVAAFALAEVGKWGVEEEDSVAILTTSNFDTFIQQNPRVFVKFYAPWCGHCKSMAKGYSDLAKRMQAEEGGIPIAKVDATVEKDLAEKYGIQGFPTLKFFVDGEGVDYQGAREENDIYSWIQKKTGPASVHITTPEELEKHSSIGLSVLLVLPADDEALKTYSNLAMSFDDVSFAHTFSEELKRSLDLEQTHNLVVFRDFDDGRKVLAGETALTLDSMKQFLEAVRFPNVMDFDQKSAERIFGAESPAMFYFTDDSNDAGLQKFREFAGNNQGKILFSYSTVTSGLGARLAEFLGITNDDAPACRIIKFKGGQLEKFVVDDLSNEGLTQALTNFLEDSLQAYYKSEPIPETNNEPVKVIVGNSFEDMVVNSNKFVLLEAYAPWCGHCKKLEPIYTELAEKLSGVEDLVIAKMDATANEHPSLNIQGFPTIKLYKPGHSEPVDYHGDRSLSDLLQFLETELGRKFDDVKSEEL
jgi:protein disulfide-isomerase A1